MFTHLGRGLCRGWVWRVGSLVRPRGDAQLTCWRSLVTRSLVTLSRSLVTLSRSLVTLSRSLVTLSRSLVTLSRSLVTLSRSLVTLSRSLFSSVTCARVRRPHPPGIRPNPGGG
jgi:hypothetical protein